MSQVTAENKRENTRGNTEVKIGEALTAGKTSADQTAHNATGLTVFLNVNTISGTSPAIDLKVQGKDPASGNYADLDSLSTASSTGMNTLQLHPADTNGVLITRTFRLVVTVDTADGDEAYDYDLGYSLVN